MPGRIPLTWKNRASLANNATVSVSPENIAIRPLKWNIVQVDLLSARKLVNWWGSLNSKFAFSGYSFKPLTAARWQDSMSRGQKYRSMNVQDRRLNPGKAIAMAIFPMKINMSAIQNNWALLWQLFEVRLTFIPKLSKKQWHWHLNWLLPDQQKLLELETGTNGMDTVLSWCCRFGVKCLLNRGSHCMSNKCRKILWLLWCSVE